MAKHKILTVTLAVLLLFSIAWLGFMPKSVFLANANPLPPPPILQIYIRSDGTIDPSTAGIQRAGYTYSFIGDITNSTIEIERDNIVLDGANFTLKGNGENWNTAITLTNRSHVVVKNIDFKNYWKSITATASSNIIIANNKMLSLWNIILDSSTDIQIIGNNIITQDRGHGGCIQMQADSSNNLITANEFCDVATAVWLSNGKNNTFYHNNFLRNNNNIVGWQGDKVNLWDNGGEGNYWSDYTGVDADGDGIGDTPYIIDDDRQDRYPLMKPFNINSVSVDLPDWVSSIPTLETATPSPQQSSTLKPPENAEASPTSLIITASITTGAVAAGIGLIVYFKKHRH